MAMEKLRAQPLPPGFGFRPSVEELCSYYLPTKVHGEKIDFDVIPDFDVYEHEPWEIPSIFPGPKSDTQWWFFSRGQKVFPSNRYTKRGCWKFIGEHKIWRNGKVIAIKITRYFNKKDKHICNEVRTTWIMKEYYLDQNDCKGVPPDKKDLCVCRVFKREEAWPKSAPADVLNPRAQDIVPSGCRGLSAPAEAESTPFPDPEQNDNSSSKGREVEDSFSVSDTKNSENMKSLEDETTGTNSLSYSNFVGSSYEDDEKGIVKQQRSTPSDTSNINIYNMKRKLLGDLCGKDGAVGFEFRPTDAELISHYLKKKVLGEKIEFDVIQSLTFTSTNRGTCLVAIFTGVERDTTRPKWYFFTPVDRERLTRPKWYSIPAKEGGYWKSNRHEDIIMENNKQIGAKQPRLFYKGQYPTGKRTVWFMNEYFLDENELKDVFSDKKDLFVLCKVTKTGEECSNDAETSSAPATVVPNAHQVLMNNRCRDHRISASVPEFVPLCRRPLSASAPEFIPLWRRALSASAPEFVPSGCHGLSAPAETAPNELREKSDAVDPVIMSSPSGNIIGTSNSDDSNQREDTEIGTGNSNNTNQQEDREMV